MKLLCSSAFMMSLALIVALCTNFFGVFPHTALPPDLRNKLTVVLLAAMLTVSLSRIPARNLSPRYQPLALMRGLVLGLVIPAFIPLLGFMLFRNTAYVHYAAGLVLVAATPFAASVAPLSLILRGDLEHAARSTIYVYIVALAWIPAVIWVFLGARVDAANLAKIVFVIIGLPLVLSRFITQLKINQERMAAVLNCTIFVLVWLSVSTADFGGIPPGIVVAFLLVAGLRTFGLGKVVDALDRKIGVGWAQRVTDILMASYKNKGIAIALCGATLGKYAPYAMVAIATSIVMDICWVIYMDSVLFSKKKMAAALHEELPAML